MELTNSQRIAAALERITDALTRIADSVDLNAYQQGYHDGVRDEAPDMSEALEAEYQRGRADERADAVKLIKGRVAKYQDSARQWLDSAVALEKRGDGTRAQRYRQVAETRTAAANALISTAYQLVEAGDQ